VIRKSAIVFCLLGGAIAGCAKVNSAPASFLNTSAPDNSASDRDAIKAAIEQHLSANSGINMSVMYMTLSKVTITGDEAQADTEFRLKQGGTSMQITYKLERRAGNWAVSDQPNGGEFAHPPIDKTDPGSASSPTTETMPDVSEFFKNRPAAPPK
jgi:hypothetical protein